MNLLLIDPDEIAPDGRANLDGRRGRHLVRVLRVVTGQRVRAGVVGGATGTAEVLRIEGDAVEVRVETDREPPPVPPAPPAETPDLVLALPRPKALRRVLRLAATMGVARLDLVNAWRVEKSFFESPVLAPEAIRRELLLGAEQGGTTRLPEVALHRLLMPFLNTLEADPRTPRLLAHPSAPDPIEGAIEKARAGREADRPHRSLIAIGPEGGWIEKELRSLQALHFHPVHLGPWTLTTEAAVAVTLGQLALLARRT